MVARSWSWAQGGTRAERKGQGGVNFEFYEIFLNFFFKLEMCSVLWLARLGPGKGGLKIFKKQSRPIYGLGKQLSGCCPPGPEPTSSTKCATAAESAGATKERDKDVPVQGLHLDACGGW